MKLPIERTCAGRFDPASLGDERDFGFGRHANETLLLTPALRAR